MWPRIVKSGVQQAVSVSRETVWCDSVGCTCDVRVVCWTRPTEYEVNMRPRHRTAAERYHSSRYDTEMFIIQGAPAKVIQFLTSKEYHRQ